ncbi:MAG: hypothetical protein Q9227_003540 [Pyrenula ochraceoflavens]
MSATDEGSAVPPASKGSWGSFLKGIANFNGDLSSLTAPAFILSTTSLVEFSAYWTEHPSLFVAPSLEPDPAKRALLVLKWFLSTLKQQYSSRSEKLGSEKKPLNPFLGELFLGKWEDDKTGVTQLVSEQVSHHPPATAYSIWNDKHGVQLQGYNAQKASFSRTIHVKQIGHALLTLTPPTTAGNNAPRPETYLITLPSLHIENLIYGNPFVELNKFTHIASSTGYVAKIDYSGRGWLSGKKNTFTASLWKEGEGDEKNPLYTADGQWSDSFVMRQGKKGKEVETYSASSCQTSPLLVAPTEKQDPFESRRAWANVAKNIDKGDMDAVSHYKTRIENAQRELRKKEREDGREWKRRFFHQAREENEPVFQKLVKSVSGAYGYGWTGIEADKTGGIWRFNADEAKNAEPPYHSEGAEALGEKAS